jgi:hypothetical protein
VVDLLFHIGTCILVPRVLVILCLEHMEVKVQSFLCEDVSGHNAFRDLGFHIHMWVIHACLNLCYLSILCFV